MAYNTTASLETLIYTNYIVFGKCQERFGWIFRSAKDSNYLDADSKVLKRDDIRDYRLVQKLKLGETDCNRFLRLRKQLAIAAEKFARNLNLSPVLMPTMTKDMEEQFKPTHKVTDVVDHANRKFCVTLLRYNVEKPEISYAPVRLFGNKKGEEKFQQLFNVKYKLAELIYLHDVIDCVNDNVNTKELICNILWKVTATISPLSFFFLIESGWVGALEKIEIYFPCWKQNWDFVMLYLQLQKRLSKILHYL